MQLPGLLVEYLIDGSVALLWIIPLLSMVGITLPSDSSKLVLFFPGLYVVGMTVDYLARFIVLRWKRKIKKQVYGQFKDKNLSSHEIQAKLTAYSSDLTNAAEMRSSRDRIARGTILNSILATVFYVLSSLQLGQLNYWVVVLGLTGIALSSATWARYQYLSYDYEIHAFLALNEKLKTSSKAKDGS